MEDAATAEISRSQIWQWINAGVEFEHTASTGHAGAGPQGRGRGTGRASAPRSARRPSRPGNWQQAHDLLLQVALDEDYADFLTLPAYEQLNG